LRNTRILKFLLVYRNWIVFKIKQYFYFSISRILGFALNYTLLEISVKSKDMTIKINPIRLVEFGRILFDIFRVEVIMSGWKMRSIIDNGLLINRLTRKRIFSGLYFVNISILLLFFCTNFPVAVFELLSGCESREKWEIRSHIFITY